MFYVDRGKHVAACKVCKRKSQKRYYSENSEQVISYQKQYRKDNAELISTSRKSYRELNSDKIKKANRNQYLKNQEQRKEQSRQWRQDNPDRVAYQSALKRTRKLQATPNWLTEDDYKWIQWFYTQAKRLEEVTGIPHHVDHIIPLKGKKVSGLHTPYNLQILTAEENMRKHNEWNEHNTN